MNNIPIEQLADKVIAELNKRIAMSGERVRERQTDGRSNGPASGDGGGGVDAEAGKKTGAGAASGAEAEASFDHIDRREALVPDPKWREGLEELLSVTPARIGVWRTGTRPLTRTMLQFGKDHAAAVDAVYGKVSDRLIRELGLVAVETMYENTENYLKRPDMGRILTDESVAAIRAKCTLRPQVQIVVSEGLSASAIEANLQDVYPALLDSLRLYDLSWGTPVFVRGSRVMCMDHIGEILQPEVLVLLIGERPGLVSTNSMSAYMCYRPGKHTVESERTVISNIHRGGTPPIEAGAHIGTVVNEMLAQKASGVKLTI